MISFVCGTYHGLFVQTEVASVLPSDLAYFDFRRNQGWAIPQGSAPNLIIRYTDDLLTVGLIYRAKEGNRGGFIAFGTLLIEPGSQISTEIERALIKAIKQAQSSKDIFDGVNLLKRPTKNDESELDLSGLPIFGGVELYGHLKFDIFKPEAIKDLASEISSIMEQDFVGFEILINSSDGLSKSELLQSFNDQVHKRFFERELEARKMKREADRKNALAALEKLKANEAEERKVFIITLTSYIIGGLALFLLGIFITYFFLFGGKTDLEAPSQENTKIDQITLNSGIETDNKAEVPIVKKEVIEKSCQFEDRKDELVNKSYLLTDIKIKKFSNDVKCVQLGEIAESVLMADLDVPNGGLERDIIFSKNSVFENELSSGRMIVSNFSNFIENFKNEGSLYDINKGGKNQYIFSLSFEKFSPRFMCSKNIFEKVDDLYKRPNFYYLVGEQSDDLLMYDLLAPGAVEILKKLYEDIGNTLKLHDKKSIEAVGMTFVDFSNNIKATKISEISDISNSCILVIEENDSEYFASSSLEDFNIYNVSTFFMAYEEVKEHIEEFQQPECGSYPKYVMAWKSKKNKTDKKEPYIFELKFLDNIDGEPFNINFKHIPKFDPDKDYVWPKDYVWGNEDSYLDAFSEAGLFLTQGSSDLKKIFNDQRSKKFCSFEKNLQIKLKN